MSLGGTLSVTAATSGSGGSGAPQLSASHAASAHLSVTAAELSTARSLLALAEADKTYLQTRLTAAEADARHVRAQLAGVQAEVAALRQLADVRLEQAMQPLHHEVSGAHERSRQVEEAMERLVLVNRSLQQRVTDLASENKYQLQAYRHLQALHERALTAWQAQTTVSPGTCTLGDGHRHAVEEFVCSRRASVHEQEAVANGLSQSARLDGAAAAEAATLRIMLQHERREAELLRDLLRERATDRASMPHRASPPVRSAVASQPLFSSPKRASQETTVAPPAASPAVRTDASPTQRVHDDTDGVDASHLGGTFRRALIERQPNTPAQVNLLTSSGLDVGGHATATWMHTLDSTPSPLFSVSVRRAGEARGGGGGGSGMQQHFRSRSPSLSPKPARACSRSRSRGTQATVRLQRRGSADAAVGSGFPDTLTTRSGDAGMQQPAAAHLAFGSSRSAAPASHASTREPKTGRSLTVDAGSSSSAAAPARLVSPSKPVERGRTLSGRASGPSPSPPHRSQSSSSVGRRGTRSGAGSPSFGGARPPSLRGDDAEVVRWKSIMSRLDTVSRLQSDRSPARR